MKGKNFIRGKITGAISLVVMIAMCTTVTYAADYNTDDISILYSDIDEHLKGAEIYNSSDNGTSVMNQMIGDNKRYIIDDIDNVYYARAIEDKIIEFTNKFREENGLEPLKNSEILRFSARYKNASMIKYGYFEHSNPNMDNCTAGKLSTNLGCDNWCAYGENIYQMSSTRNIKFIDVSAYNIFNDWKNSPGHRANMLQDHYTYIGVAVSVYEDEEFSYVYSTQHFFGDIDAGEPVNNQVLIKGVPNEEKPKPGEEEKPTEDEPKPGEEEKPTEDELKPGEEEKPTEDEPKPGEEEKPTEDEPKPGEEEKPTEDEPKPGEEEKPTEDEPKPGEEEKPTEDEPSNSEDIPVVQDPINDDVNSNNPSTNTPIVEKPPTNVSDNTAEELPNKTGDSTNMVCIFIVFGINIFIIKSLYSKKEY